MKSSIKNILIVGVGGQGVILASNILSEVAMISGFDVKKNEAHGQSQRSGSVPSHIRYGKKVYSPIISPGEADIILAFEELEGLRWAHYMKSGGKIIINNQRIYPTSVTSGVEKYPEDVISILKKGEMDVMEVDGMRLANQMGNPLVISTILLGVLSNYLVFSESKWIEMISKIVPEKHRNINIEAFKLGREEGRLTPRK
jgi:indolepyruvate ferredoxin oxidoreductase beta subunit